MVFDRQKSWDCDVYTLPKTEIIGYNLTKDVGKFIEFAFLLYIIT